MIQHRIDRSSMAYCTQQPGARRRGDPVPHEKHASKCPRACVGVASLRLRRRMPPTTPACEPRLKPPPAQRQLFAWAASRAAAVVSAPTRSAHQPPKRVPSDADARTAAALP